MVKLLFRSTGKLIAALSAIGRRHFEIEGGSAKVVKRFEAVTQAVSHLVAELQNGRRRDGGLDAAVGQGVAGEALVLRKNVADKAALLVPGSGKEVQLLPGR